MEGFAKIRWRRRLWLWPEKQTRRHASWSKFHESMLSTHEIALGDLCTILEIVVVVCRWGWVCVKSVQSLKEFQKQTWFESYFLLALIISATFAYCCCCAVAAFEDSDDDEDTEQANRRGGGGALLLLLQVLVVSSVAVSSLLSARPRQTESSGDCIIMLSRYLSTCVVSTPPA